MAVKPKKKKKKGAAAKKKLSPDELKQRKIQNDHKRVVRSMFKNAGFERVPEVSDAEITFDGRMGDFDDVFVLENLIVMTEYTAANASGVSAHLLTKKIIFGKVQSKPKEFVEFLKQKFPAFAKRLGTKFHADDIHLRIIYCSRNEFDAKQKLLVPEAIYLDYPELKYFEKLSTTIK